MTRVNTTVTRKVLSCQIIGCVQPFKRRSMQAATILFIE